MVGAQDPLGQLPLLAGVTDQRVLNGIVQGVPHVQNTGDVRRRDRDRIVLLRGTARLRVIEP